MNVISILQPADSSQDPVPLPTPAATGTGKRLIGSESTATPSSVKRQRITGPEAIMNVGQSLSEIASSISGAFGQAGETSPVRRKRAQVKIQRADELPELTLRQKTKLLMIFQKDVAAADTYENLGDEFRLQWALDMVGDTELF